ncbi:MAG TPA: glycoside hydrolase family protein [Pseudomonadales bacterium]|nr:glycoside hydrolase family protein [Pseudomonadales bacterium]
MTSFSMDKLYEELATDEGKVLHTYLDSLGFLTIGIGHLVADDEFEEGDTITEEQCFEIFKKDVQTAIFRLGKVYPHYSNLTDARQRALINMTFNMGMKLANFKMMLAALDAGNYDEAANQMLNSLWAHQVGDRAKRLAQMMRAG